MQPNPIPETRTEACEQHGVYESMHLFTGNWSRCPACTEEDLRKEQRLYEHRNLKERTARWISRCLEAGIPERFVDATFDTYKPQNPSSQEAWLVIQAYAACFVPPVGRGMIWVGKIGTGKTHLAAATIIELMRRGETAKMATVQAIIRRIKNTWARDLNDHRRETETEVMESYTYPDLLIVDEVGVQFGSDFERNLFFEIVDARYSARKATIFISNLPAEKVTELLGERVMDRLREDGGRVLTFDWDSYRKEQL